MRVHQAIVSGLLAGCITAGSSSVGIGAAQSGGAVSRIVWENDRMQVRRVFLGPGDELESDSTGGSIIVFLTADFDGRVPSAEAAWRDPGPVTMSNHGRTRLEALVVDLKGGATPSSHVTPPEVVRASGMMGPGIVNEAYNPRVRAEKLIANDRISVTKERYDSPWSVDPLHVHPQDAVVIYLRGGSVWASDPFAGPELVRRGDVRVVPGMTFHVTGNAGSDPLEFLLLIPS
jgi:hypothetical protein